MISATCYHPMNKFINLALFYRGFIFYYLIYELKITLKSTETEFYNKKNKKTTNLWTASIDRYDFERRRRPINNLINFVLLYYIC